MTSIIYAQQEALIPKWESTGLLSGCTSLEDKRTMAQLLETQRRQMIVMKEHNEDSTAMSITKMPDLDRLLPIMLPLTVRIYQPIISSIGAMNLPAGSTESGGVIVARTRALPTKVPHISIMDTNLRPFDNTSEFDYCTMASNIIHNDILDFIKTESNKVDADIKTKYYAYVPFIFAPMMNSEFQYTHYNVVIRGAFDRIFPESIKE
jgi:hypothetical protein